jgi:hypothetical protein
MAQMTTAGRLLNDLERDSITLRKTVVHAAGIVMERAESAMRGTSRLSLSEQLRLSEATALVAPDFARQAARLRAQVLAARSFESGDVECRLEAPAQRWERASGLRR